MNRQIEQQLNQRIESFARDITSLLQRAVADTVADALGPGGRVRGGAAARGGKAVDIETLLKEIKRAENRRMEEIAESMQTSTRMLRLPMKKLIEAKKVKTTGQARGTRYRSA